MCTAVGLTLLGDATRLLSDTTVMCPGRNQECRSHIIKQEYADPSKMPIPSHSTNSESSLGYGEEEVTDY